ncbi:MAG: hypothetical protein R3E98_18185 [Gemmatimonadota bacterium]
MVADGGQRFVVTRHGNELAAMVLLRAASLLERLRELLEKRDVDVRENAPPPHP